MSLKPSDRLGTVVEVTTPVQVEFVAEESVTPEVGDYVAVVHEGGSWILGMITHVERGSRELSGRSLLSASEADRIIELVGEPRQWARAKVKLLGRVEEGPNGVRLVLPRTPPPSGAGVYKAPAQSLQAVFSPSCPGVAIGSLLTREDVKVVLDPNEMISRHLAVLAVTGAGKSNTVAVIVEKLLELNGVVLLFDLHSEYSGMTLSLGARGEVVTLDPKINVNSLSLGEFSYLLGISYEKAARQYIYLRRLWRAAWALRGKDLLDSIIREAGIEDPEPGNVLDGMIAIAEVVKDAIESGEVVGSAVPLGGGVSLVVDKDAKNSLYGLISRLTHLKESKRQLLSATAPEIISTLENGRVVVVDMGPLGEDAADVLVGHTLTTLLAKAKEAISARRSGEQPPEDAPPLPVMVVLEEAHILIPNDRDTYTRHAASRVAREGRKFGIGLTLVSQRPKRLDSDVLSQMVNKIILKVVEPEDQAYVRRATEFLSEDLVSYLPSLNVGEAVIVGPMVRLPAIVKVDLFGGKRGGESLRATEEWAKAASSRRAHQDDGGGYDELVG